MTEYTATNGVMVWDDGDKLFMQQPNAHYSSVPGVIRDGLAEFFQDRRDTELGRWRRGNHIISLQSPVDGFVHVYDELSGQCDEFAVVDVLRNTTDDPTLGEMQRTALYYLHAHPERKPAWHDAKPGEVWLLTILGVESAFYPSKSIEGVFTPVAPNTGTTAVAFNWPEITAGRRIWPEVQS